MAIEGLLLQKENLPTIHQGCQTRASELPNRQRTYIRVLALQLQILYRGLLANTVLSLLLIQLYSKDL